MEKWISILQTYNEVLTVASIVAVGLILAITLLRILRQIKRLNRSLSGITQNVQAYFDVIMQEEPEAQGEPEAAEVAKMQGDLQGRSPEDESLLEQEQRKQELLSAKKKFPTCQNWQRTPKRCWYQSQVQETTM